MLFNTYQPGKFAFSKEFYSLDELKNISKNESKWGIIGVPFDCTSSYHSGSRLGPTTIREASHNFEKYNISYNRELTTLFYDFGDLEVVHGNCSKTLKILEETIIELLTLGFKPLLLGGEHSISLSPLNALSHKYNIDEITVVHFDAHMDMIDTYQGEKCSHATVMKRIYDLGPKKIIQIGVRSTSTEENDFVNSKENIEVFESKDIKNNIANIKKALLSINGFVYVSIDLDVLDPSYLPRVGNPIPNGISTNDIEQLLQILSKKDIIGFDLVELATNTLGDISAVTATKIVYDFLTLMD
jgi:agmatinase